MFTGLYASLLMLWLTVLSCRVIALKGNRAFRWFAFGNNDSKGPNRAIRAQGKLAASPAGLVTYCASTRFVADVLPLRPVSSSNVTFCPS